MREDYRNKRAVVIGASMGGLLAARALADYYGEVTVVERDALPDGYEPRKGVPQGRHTHGLLARGREVLEQLFPGFTDEMVAQGATAGDIVDKVLWFNHGFYLHNSPSNLHGLAISRPMLEGSVRRRLLQLPNIRLCERCAVLEPTFDRAQGRVTGVRVQSQGGSDGAQVMNADFVVDASGRGSSSPAWLDAWGYPKPREELIKIGLGYVTRQYRRLPEHLRGMSGAIIAACPPDWRFGVMLSQEGDRWIVTVGGYLGDHAPTDDSGFVDFARSLQKPEIFDVVRAAEPLCPLMPYQFNANLRRHYQELSRFPAGFFGVWRRLVQLQSCLRSGDDRCLHGIAGFAGMPGGRHARNCRTLLSGSEPAHRYSLANCRRQRSSTPACRRRAHDPGTLHQLVHRKILSRRPG
jgi:hypothetical protein